MPELGLIKSDKSDELYSKLTAVAAVEGNVSVELQSVIVKVI
jgi:hypothetical protein